MTDQGEIRLGDRRYNLSNVIRVSRPIYTQDTIQTPQAFYLPTFQYKPVEIGDFVGDLAQGGSCNVRTVSFTPHNLTHLEVSSHVLEGGNKLTDLSPSDLQGEVYLIDLSKEDFDDVYIQPKHIQAQINQLPKDAQLVGIKTKYSLMTPNFEFSGTDPLCLHPDTTSYLRQELPELRALILDLPSVDREDDGGLLAAHKNFFTLAKNYVVELAYFDTLKEGYYYCVLTPYPVELDAMITDIYFYPEKT